jgi:hypothetical protein
MWEGQYGSRKVAVKVLKVYTASGVENTRNVGCT